MKPKPQKSNLEFEGPTVEEAIKKAIAELKVDRRDLKITVVSEEEKGLFGMAGAKLAKIRIDLIARK